MSSALQTFAAHAACFSRLAWVPSPHLRARLGTAMEYWRLAHLQRRITAPGGLYAELRRLVNNRPSNQRRISHAEARDLLTAQVHARWLHPTALCLAKSLRILECLRDAGVYAENVRFRVGLRRAAVGYRGHAWVECDGRALLEDAFEEDEYEQVWDGEELLRLATGPSASQQSERRYQVKAGILIHAFAEDEAAALDLRDGTSFELTGCGLRIWQAILATGEVESAVDEIAAESGADREMVHADVEEFARALIEAKLVSHGTC